MYLEKLKEPFSPDDIEWRLQSCGKNSNGFYGKCLAYITNRAIQTRLDEVCGPLGWKNEFITGPNGGILCGLSIKSGEEWITKWDGAENTQIEAVKGGLSDSMKRAAVQWGIGRYLYNLDEAWIKVSEKGKYYGKTPEKESFHWDPPALPEWALSKEDSSKIEELKQFLKNNVLKGDAAARANEYLAKQNMKGITNALAYINNEIDKGGN